MRKICGSSPVMNWQLEIMIVLQIISSTVVFAADMDSVEAGGAHAPSSSYTESESGVATTIVQFIRANLVSLVFVTIVILLVVCFYFVLKMFCFAKTDPSAGLPKSSFYKNKLIADEEYNFSQTSHRLYGSLSSGHG